MYVSSTGSCDSSVTVSISTMDGDRVVDPGNTLTLLCVVTNATNMTQVMWTGPQPQVPLSETDMSFNDATNEQTSTLMIANVNYTDGGDYMCSVMLDNTNYSDSIFIVIRPTISPPELMARAGSTTSNFTCNVQSLLASSVVWYMYDQNGGSGEIVTTGSGSGMVAYVDTMLDFMTVMFDDAGLYQCAVNATDRGLGEITSSNATLTGKHECSLSALSFQCEH